MSLSSLRDEMQSVLDNTAIDEMLAPSVECTVAIMFGRIMNMDVYIWSENDLHVFVRLLKGYGLKVRKVVSFLSNDFDKVDDVDVVKPSAILNQSVKDKLIFLNMTDYQQDENKKILSTLSRLGCKSIYGVTDSDRRRMIGHSLNRFDRNRIVYYQSHKEELMQLFDLLADQKSKRTLVEYLRSYLMNTTYRGEQNSLLYKYFFGSKGERLYEHLTDECWVNCGASVGDTIFTYISWGLHAKKIYAFEGDPVEYKKLISCLDMLPLDKRSMIEPINAMIDSTTDFQSILKSGGGRCTLLNADIEGSELDLLKSMADVIRKDRPVVAICVYHLPQDLVVIPAFLRSLCDDYVYHLRKYTTGWLMNYKQNHELVLYAIPRARSLVTK